MGNLSAAHYSRRICGVLMLKSILILPSIVVEVAGRLGPMSTLICVMVSSQMFPCERRQGLETFIPETLVVLKISCNICG